MFRVFLVFLVPGLVAAEEFPRYRYTAKVVSVYDADTITVDVDLGFGITSRQRLRLNRIDAWEVRGPEKQKGLVARDWLRERLHLHSVVFVKTEKDRQGKFGRYLAELYIKEDGRFLNLNNELVRLGHAEYKDY